MKKSFIVLVLLLILASCSNNIQKTNINVEGDEKATIKQNYNIGWDRKTETSIMKQSKNINFFEAKASWGTTDFTALNINSSNFNKQNSKIDEVLSKSDLQEDKIQIAFEASNHVYSYEDIDYINQITLWWNNPIDYKVVDTKMWWHHVIVLLDFKIWTKIDILEFKNSPVWDISLIFNK